MYPIDRSPDASAFEMTRSPDDPIARCTGSFSIIALMPDSSAPAPDSAAARPPAAAAKRASADDRMLCERCSAEMFRMHAVWRCPACGFKTDCCGW
jgi:hypothetical protein